MKKSHNMKLSKEDRNKLWGDSGPYSQVRLIIENRILDNERSRQFLIVSVNINPFTFEYIRDHINDFKQDVEVLGILEHGKYRDLSEGYECYSFMSEFHDRGLLTVAEKRVSDTEAAVIRMHEYIMDHFELGQLKRHGEREAIVNIQDVFTEFLRGQHIRLAQKTYDHYVNAIGLFETCLDGYGEIFIDDQKRSEFEQAQKKQGSEEILFTEYFHPSMLHYSDFGHFLDYFLPRKVMVGKDTAKKYSTAIICLYKWMHEKGYIKTVDVKGDISELREDFRQNLDSY